ncbi:hypothetical protein BJV74DRAFT_377469 [Russula compacta]|nr:hypothetical protein BJV74DRAFT_377469 [Russula compacta]
MASAQNRTAYRFKPGSSYSDGLLTFKFDTTASGWDSDVYVGVVQKLVDVLVSKDDKSILDGPAARALWEAVTRVQEDRLIMSDPEPMILDLPKENTPKPPSKTRARLKPRTDATATAEIFVRRSARLSGTEQKRFSPKPDPDEVILGYRSGTGSLNITNGDVSRLKPGEFLNDTLIEFGLKLWLADLQESNPELASQVHVFNSFFYKKLSTKIPEEGYNSVRKWTSKFDLFRKKYIIVPINENLHWYLAIIYFPEYTLLPQPVQETSLQPRRSTRHLRVIIDSLDAQQPELALGQLLPPDPDPPPNGQVDRTVSSEHIVPESPRTDDQKDEIDVERMVESACTPVDPTAMRVDGQEEVGTPNTEPQVTHCLDSPLLMYHQGVSLSHEARLSSLDPQDDGTERLDHPALTLTGGSEGDTIRTSGILPSTFYGTKHPEQGDASPQLVPTETSAVPEIEIEEDETMGNPESEQEEATKHPRTYIFTFDSLASKHPQAVKRLSRYLLMEAHDKKQLAEDTLTEPKGMQAIVPAQPNYCDCGIYLLHFAKTFMKDPKLSSDIIRNKGRRVPHEHWDGASAGSYREELAARIYSMSEEWKKQRGEQDSGMKNQADGTAPPEQPHGDPTPTASLKAEDDSDSDIEVLGSPQKATPSTVPRRDSSGLAGPRKKGPAARVR